MKYWHSLREAAEFSQLTLKKLEEHNLPADPIHYTVWYEYVADLNAALSNIINDNLKRMIFISKDLSYYFYTQYILNRSKSPVSELESGLASMLAEVFADISSGGDDSSIFGIHLSDFAQNLSLDADKATFKNSLKELILGVTKIGEDNEAVSESLKLTHSEIKTLQNKLKEFEQFANMDALTGLNNRRSFEEEITKYIAKCTHNGGDLSVIMADIDHFRRINDTHGHLVGDDLLRIVSKTMRDQVKRKDIVYRYGGEEFVIIMPETPLEGAVSVAETIRKHFADTTWKQKSSGVSLGKITLSFGVAAYIPGEKGEAFINRANKALYQSKSTGRNRVSVADN